MSAKFRERYGERPLHLVAAAASFAIVGYAVLQIAGQSAPISFAIFFAGAIIAHDLISFPLYSALNAIAGRASAAVLPGPAGVNYVRVPALLSGFALVVWFPLILGLDPAAYESAAGQPPADYLGRWLLLTAALFAGSGVVLALRIRSRRKGPATDRPGARTPR